MRDEPTPRPATGTVVSCHRYPVKSMQGAVVDHLQVHPSGIEGDRAFGLIDASSGHLLSAKRVAALLQAEADDEAITLPDGTRLNLGDPSAHDVLSAWLGRDVRLVAAADAGAVSYEMTFDPPDDQAEVFEIPVPEGTLLDLTPVHAITTASLAACADARPDLDWDVRRFRPNLVLDVEQPAFGEQAWTGREVRLGTAILRCTGPMVRCALPLRPQPGGLDRQPELFRALSELNTGAPNHLGICLEVEQPGRISTGDDVIVA